MEEEYSNSGQPKVSKYNTAVAQTYRLDDLTKDTHNHSRKNDYLSWNKDLDRIWVELAKELDAKDDKDKFNEIKSLDIKLKLLGLFVKLNVDPIIPTSKAVSTLRQKQYEILMEKDIFIGKLQNKLGKGSAYADPDQDDM